VDNHLLLFLRESSTAKDVRSSPWTGKAEISTNCARSGEKENSHSGHLFALASQQLRYGWLLFIIRPIKFNSIDFAGSQGTP
jgi:hypothetical protein